MKIGYKFSRIVSYVLLKVDLSCEFVKCSVSINTCSIVSLKILVDMWAMIKLIHLRLE